MKRKIKRAASVILSAAALFQFTSCSEIVEQAGFHPPEGSTTTSSTAVSTEPTETTAATSAPAKGKVMRGDLYDSNGIVLMYSEHDESGKEVRMTNDANKVSFANVLNEMSEGIDLTFDEKLRVPENVGDERGQSLRLTFDSNAQNAIYDYMQSMNMIGTAVVMRTDGSLMAQVSYPSYDPDEYYGKETEEDLAWGTYGNKAFQNFPPGSCFKIMSEVISDKHGVYSLYDEGEWKFDGVSIVNWDHDTNRNYPMERSLYSAFINSSNIFFARSFDTIGIEPVLDDLNSIFHFGKSIQCDFGSLDNNIEIYCQDDLRRTAFGQSYILTCPIYLAALGREAVFGDMVKPFVLKNVVRTDDPATVITAGTKPNEVIASIPEEYRQNLLNGMAGVGSDINVWVPAGYTFYAKTGTAETWENDFLYITGCVKSSSDDGTRSWEDYSSYDGSYIVVIQVRNPAYFGYSFASQSAALYQGIINCLM